MKNNLQQIKKFRQVHLNRKLLQNIEICVQVREGNYKEVCLHWLDDQIKTMVQLVFKELIKVRVTNQRSQIVICFFRENNRIKCLVIWVWKNVESNIKCFRIRKKVA